METINIDRKVLAMLIGQIAMSEVPASHKMTVPQLVMYLASGKLPKELTKRED